MTAADNVPPAALGAIGYRKPAALLFALRNHVVGKESFDAAFRAYTQAWAFKHPTPGDFFRFIENYTGTDLAWFWRTYWYSTATINIGVDSVATQQNHTAAVYLRNVTGAPFPVTIRVKYKTGKTQDVTFPADIWATDSTFQAIVPAPDVVTGVRIFPDPTVPDWNTGNKTWGDAPAGDPPHPVSE
jgi:aminopeptidase N